MTYFDPNAVNSPFAPSLALLALKRFARSLVKSVGLGMVSLLIFLNLGTHLHEMPSEVAASFTTADAIAAQRAAVHRLAATTPPSQTISQTPSQTTSGLPHRLSGHVLSASMTQHRITSSRLSIPSISSTPTQLTTSVANTN